MDYGNLSLIHDILGKLYLLCFNLEEDSTFTKEDAVKDLQEVFKGLIELMEDLSIRR